MRTQRERGKGKEEGEGKRAARTLGNSRR